MFFKENWEETQKRFEAFWACDMLDRACVAVSAPRDEPLIKGLELKLRQPESLEQRWTDPDMFLDTFEFAVSYTYFAGEALPSAFVNLGPGVLASWIGADYSFQEGTVWYGQRPVLNDWAARKKLSMDESHPLWKATAAITEKLASRAKDRYLVSMTDLGGGFDVALSLRGTMELIYDLMDCPGEVVKLVEEIDDIWFDCYRRLEGIIRRGQDGITCWIPLYSREPWYPLQCDVSANFSPSLFDRYVKPSLEREAAFLGRAIYHLDGPDAVKYIDSILDIEKIAGIQWVPGDTGVPESSMAHDVWMPLYRKIQKKKKCIVLLGVPPHEIEKILGTISAKGLFITTNCASRKEADELLRNVKRWSRT